MARIYNELKDEYENEGYLPFVCIIEWPPESELTAIQRYTKISKRLKVKASRGCTPGI